MRAVGALCAAAHSLLFAQWWTRLQWRVAMLVVMAGVLFSGTAAKAESLTFSTAPGGVLVGGSGTAFTATFGNMNGLGAGTIPAGLTAVPMSNGTLYYTPIRMTVGAIFSTAWVSAYVSTNGHPTALVPYACPYPLSCTASGDYSPLSTSAGSPTTIIAKPGVANNTTVTIGVGFFLPDNNGASAYTGTSNVVITFKVTNNVLAFITQTVTLTLTTTVQTAVELTLDTAPGGATINPGGGTDYTLSFGNVNALGIGPAAGLTTTAIAGGMIYHTPYQLNSAFSAMSSTTGTIKVYVSTNFAHPTLLSLRDASATNGPYTAISTNAGAQTQITNAAADRASMTRYLGLFVSNVNGATAFNGTDTAILTFTLTVP
jgi:hypothetical protein